METDDDRLRSLSMNSSIDNNEQLHMMFSYCWENKDNVKHIYDLLDAEFPNITKWIDINEMEGNIMEAMSDAVENSFVVIIFLSRAYLNSKNCKTESELVIGKQKKFLLVLLEKGYPYLENNNENWLSKMYKNQFYIDLSNGMNQDSIDKLKQLINNEIIKTYGEDSFQSSKRPSFLSKKKNSKNNIFSSPSTSIHQSEDSLDNFILDNNLNQDEIDNIKELMIYTPRTMVPVLTASGMSFKGILSIIQDVKLNSVREDDNQ